jgi:hypothetical protein
MAFIFQPNNYIINRGASILYEWKVFMTSTPPNGPGWLVVSSGDSISFNLSGDIITSGNSGSGGLYNNGSWFVIQSPSSRQFVFQQTSANNFFIGYSKNGLYTGGDSTTRPTATDENVLLNTSGFLYASVYDEATYPKCVMQFGADDSGESSFYIIGTSPFTDYQVSVNGMVMEEVTPIDKTNITQDNVVFHMYSSSDTFGNYSMGNMNKDHSYIDTYAPRVIGKVMEGTSLESFSLINLKKLTDYRDSVPSNAGKNIYSSRLVASALIYGMSGGSNAIGSNKGIGKNILSIGTRIPIGTIVDMGELGVFTAFRDLLFPFPKNTKCLTN